MPSGLVILTAVVSIFIAWAIRVTPENARYAEYLLGRYRGLVGPGLWFQVRGIGITWGLIRVGDIGELLSEQLGRFGTAEVPVTVDRSVPLGSRIRVVGFQGAGREATVLANPEQGLSRAITCPKCGHEITT
jgi:hypothetical protein